MKALIAGLQRRAMPMVFTGMVLCLGSFAAERVWTGEVAEAVLGPATTVGFVLIVVGLVGVFLPSGGNDDVPPRTVHPPVAGRWLAMNSPASKVPSHGVRAYGQSHAIDLVHDPVEGPTRPAFGEGSGMARPVTFPAFGQPVLSMVDGTVVRVRDGARDHRSRNAWWSLIYLLVEGSLRELGGSGKVVGNHIVVHAGDGSFALVAHLQRTSAMVREGDRVVAGQPIARCGNSGNSSEPHVHAQLMDRASAGSAQGLPMRFTGVRVGDDAEPRDGMPRNDEYLTVPQETGHGYRSGREGVSAAAEERRQR